MITCVIPVLNQHELAHKAIELLCQGNRPDDFDVLVIDGGSDEPFVSDRENVTVIRFDEPIGVYPTFKIALENTTSDILAFFHSDFFVYEKNWFRQVEGAFRGDKKLGLVGFLGSSQWDVLGGRGGGTMGNFIGKKDIDGKWNGSVMSDHGATIPGQLRNAVVLDGCSMIFTRECLSSLPLDSWNCIHHMYDRVLCAWTLERGFKIAVLGIATDHISGQTANRESKYDDLGRKWAEKNLGISQPTEWLKKNKDWVLDPMNPSRKKDGQVFEQMTLGNWDSVIYLEAERRFLKEFRDEKHVIPRQV